MARFTKGKSGNPSGRPCGVKDKRITLREAFQKHQSALIEAVIEQALRGDTAALRICLDRIVAPLKSNPVRIDGFTGGTLAERGEAVMAAIAAGEIAVEEGGALLNMLQSQVRLVEATELDTRITALEQQAGSKNGAKS